MVYVSFTVFRAFDTDSDGLINEDEWVIGMSTFLKGGLEEQAKCKFMLRDFLLYSQGPNCGPYPNRI